MNKKSFMASSWFETNTNAQTLIDKSKVNTTKQSAQSTKHILTAFDIAPENINTKATVNNYFVPGWKGESLISKDVKSFNCILDKFHKDAKSKFHSKLELPRKLKVLIYNEFLSYSEFHALNCTGLDHYTNFWSELKNEDSQYRSEIDRFINVFSFRIAVVYLLKVRFILTLQEKTEEKFDIKNIFYPNSYLTKIFKTASSVELKSKAFEQNVFSWYRPGEFLKNELIQFKKICSGLKITEIIKNISIKSEQILHSKTDYSHSISHKHFGLFLNDLLINFPLWLNSLSEKPSHTYIDKKQNIEVISTKFCGDNLESLALSHWLAQNTNKEIKWDQILCPDFKNSDFSAGIYLKTIHELQFLTFLAQIAGIQGKEPKQFISGIINSHLYNRKNTNNLQKSLLLGGGSESHSTYDRIILNLNQFPKNNPQHFLFTQIANQQQFMKENGYLYVITSKKLFVPSQKNKVESLLKTLKIEGQIDLGNVSGKGEVGSYIYIFSNNLFKSVHPQSKHNCMSFRYHGQLSSFQDFSKITILNQGFYQKHLKDTPPLYQNFIDNFRLEFFQDAIVNGQLIHSSSKDSSKVTHPHFFQKLMELCHPFDYFFDLQTVNFDESQDEAEDSLFNFSHSFKREKSPFTIIVDQRSKDSVNIQIIPTSALEVKSYEYGHALCSYFYAYPKWPNLSILSIKDYLCSSVGRQIINLTFSNEVRKVKGNLNKVLIPKYFTDPREIPDHILPGLKLLNVSTDDILSLHPAEMDKNYTNLQGILPSLVKSYPATTLALLSNFKRSVYTALEKIGCLNKSASINFNNPILKSPLLLSKTYPIYPDNKDVYIDFNPEALEQIHSQLVKCKKITSTKDGYTNYGLELYTDSKQPVVTIYSDDYMINFIEFLMGNILHTPISKILQGVQVPKLDDLKSILGSYNSLTRFLTGLNKQLPKDYDLLLNSTILNINH